MPIDLRGREKRRILIKAFQVSVVGEQKNLTNYTHNDVLLQKFAIIISNLMLAMGPHEVPYLQILI